MRTKAALKKAFKLVKLDERLDILRGIKIVETLPACMTKCTATGFK